MVLAGFARVEQIATRQEHNIARVKQVQQQAALERKANTARFAESDRNQIEALRTLLCTLRKNTLTSRQRTEEEKQAVIRFYQIALESIHARPCNI